MVTRSAPPAGGPTILLIGADDELAYLMRRYAGHGPDRVRIQPADPTPAELSPGGDAVLWFASVAGLADARPRERGLVSEDMAIIVSSSASDDRLAHELGADHCARQPLTLADFRAALVAVGLVDGTPVTVDQGREG